MRIPFPTVTSPSGDIARLETAALRNRGGLNRGERAFVAVAAALQRGDHAAAQRLGREAARLLRDPRPVDLLIEEGFPSPLTGRLGALAGAAASLSAIPARIGPHDITRLAAAGVTPDEMADLVLVCAANGLGGGRPDH
ncbi:hypothetical protein [Paenirhodobacter sp.]|uniref:hypothetical protein n=1 Tax=Paenirhodobacter sp. TaxID=1965326 RepID=UPI003B3EBB82